MEDVRVYGDIKGISPEAFETLKRSMPFDQIKYDGHTLSVDYEGVYIDIEDFVETALEVMDPACWGGVDFIDHVEWEVTRYVLKGGKLTTKVVKVDNVLEPLGEEIGL